MAQEERLGLPRPPTAPDHPPGARELRGGGDSQRVDAETKVKLVKKNWRGLSAALLAFVICYSAGFEARSWIEVYVFDSWDPKLGGKSGNIDLDHLLTPFCVGIATVSYLCALAMNWHWTRSAPSKPLIWASVGGALLSAVAWYTVDLWEVVTATPPQMLAWIVLFCGPAVSSSSLFELAQHLSSSKNSGGSVERSGQG